MNFLRALFTDYITQAGPGAAEGEARRFIEWAEADLAQHPVSSVQQDIGLVRLFRAGPRAATVLAVGRTVKQPPFRAVSTTAGIAAGSPGASAASPHVISCFQPVVGD